MLADGCYEDFDLHRETYSSFDIWNIQFIWQLSDYINSKKIEWDTLFNLGIDDQLIEKSEKEKWVLQLWYLGRIVEALALYS